MQHFMETFRPKRQTQQEIKSFWILKIEILSVLPQYRMVMKDKSKQYRIFTKDNEMCACGVIIILRY